MLKKVHVTGAAGTVGHTKGPKRKKNFQIQFLFLSLSSHITSMCTASVSWSIGLLFVVGQMVLLTAYLPVAGLLVLIYGWMCLCEIYHDATL